MAFLDRLIALGFKSYAEYLDGEHWRNFKANYKASGKPRCCTVCKSRPIQLHHHTYERLGDELLTDVTPLCHSHHKHVHGILKKHEWFVEKTQQAIAEIRDALVTATQKPKERRHKKKKAKVKLLFLNMKRKQFAKQLHKVYELSKEEMVFLFRELVKRGYVHPEVPDDYKPSIDHGILPRHLVFMVQSWKEGITREKLTEARRAMAKRCQRDQDYARFKEHALTRSPP